MSLDHSQQSKMHHRIVQLAIKGDLTWSISALESSVGEAVRSHMRWSQQGSARERLEVQVRDLIRIDAGQGLPKPPILDWLGAASRLTADAEVSQRLLAIHGDLCRTYGRPDLVLSDDGAEDNGEDESVDLDHDEWDDENEEPERVRDWVFAADELMEPGDELAEAFTLEPPAKARLTVESNDLVTLGIVSDADFRRWEKNNKAIFFRRDTDILAASTWCRDDLMSTDGELVQFNDFDLPGGEVDWRLVVRHTGSRAVHVKVELAILY